MSSECPRPCISKLSEGEGVCSAGQSEVTVHHQGGRNVGYHGQGRHGIRTYVHRERRSVVEAARRMLSEEVGSLPVVKDDELVGMITDRDVVLQVVAKDLDPHKVPISDVCSEKPVTAQPDEPLAEALQRMAREQVRRLPVVADGRLVGILAQADIARTAHAESPDDSSKRSRRGDSLGGSSFRFAPLPKAAGSAIRRPGGAPGGPRPPGVRARVSAPGPRHSRRGQGRARDEHRPRRRRSRA